MAIKFNIENTEPNNTFALLRTNPKMSSNLKLVVDSAGDIFLSAFKANKTLSKVEYQKHELKPDGFYPNDVARFFKNVKVNETFQILRKSSDLTPYSDYEFQYEDQYNYGASFNSTKLYDEQYKLFAPIWLDRRIPKKFVVYRVDGVDYTDDYSNDTLGQNDRILDLLKNATIIKTFDLTKSSKIGKYLDKFVYDKGLPTSAIHFNFGEDAETKFRGIDILKGGFAEKTEFLGSEYTRQDSIEIESNEFLTEGFERNGLISANLINLEFLFDDKYAEDYKIYRYFGIYVDDIPEVEFDINTVTNDDQISIVPESVVSKYDLEGTSLTDLDMLPSPSDLQLPILGYVNAEENVYLHIKNGINFRENRLPVSIYGEKPAPTEYKKRKNKVQAEDKSVSNKPFIKLNVIGTPNVNDRFFIADKTELGIDNYNLYDFTCIADPLQPASTYFKNTTQFSSQGNFNQIALAIGRVIESITNYKVTVSGTSVIIEDYAAGSNRKRMVFGLLNSNLFDFIEVEVGTENQNILDNSMLPAGSPTDFNDWTVYTAKGGSVSGGSFLVKTEELGDIKSGLFVKEPNKESYARIEDIVNDFNDSNLYRVILSKAIKLPSDGIIQLYERFRPTVGKFNAFPLKDFDFDFYSNSNSNIGELQYELDNDEFASSFIGLSPILNQEDPDDQQQYAEIKSEYDRLSENKLKETALKSRVVPYISKFALKEGTNARNLPYVLNVNEAFGTDNLSPNIELESGRSSDNLNMEHFHFNKITQYLYDDNLKGLNSYVDFTNTGGLTLEHLKSTDVDYFSLYLKWHGCLNSQSEWVDDKSKNLYTRFVDGNGLLPSSTVFRGLRYVYKKRKETVKEQPTEFLNTTEANGYKLATIVNYETAPEITSNSVSYEVVKNDVFKFICVFITLYVVENDIQSLSRSIAYNANDIQLNGSPVDTEISFRIDLERSEFETNNIGQHKIYASIFDEIAGNSNFTNEVTKNEEGNYSWIYFNAQPDPNLPAEWKGMLVQSIISDSEIIVTNRPSGFDLMSGTLGGIPMSDGEINSIDPETTKFYYWNAGIAGWKNLFEELVSYRFAQRFNQYDDIKYTTVKHNSELENEFVLEIQDGVELVKPSVLQTSPDGDRPKSYQLASAEIGKVISKRNDGGYFTVLRRMNGDYSPIFKDVVSFTDVYTHHRAHVPQLGETTVHMEYATSEMEREHIIYDKFKGCNIAFASYKNVDASYGFIENMFFHKVNDENSRNLLKLSETSDKLPLYPAIGEIAIDSKNVNVFKSKYADDYFTKSLSGGTQELTHGTLTPTELRSFLASTVMKVKDVYALTNFTSQQESGIDSLDSIRRDRLETHDIHWIESDSEIIADFYLPKSIYNELLEDGIFSKYTKYLEAENSFGDKESIQDDLEKYVYRNIVNRFIIDSIDIYGIEGKNLDSAFIAFTEPSDISKNGFTQQTNFEIQGYQNDGLSFRLIYNKKIGYQYNLKVHVKIQA